MNKIQIVKDKSRLVKKLFIMVWCVLALHLILKLTFNYWQPYVIPTKQLQVISDFVDNNRWVEAIIDKSFYIFNVCVMVLTGIRKWKFEKQYPVIIIFVCCLISTLDDLTPLNTIIDSIVTIFTLIILPLIIDKKKWLTILLTFALNFIFLYLSLWLEEVSNVDFKPYIIKMFLVFDYYIMLILNYFLFNLLKRKGQ